MQFGEEAESDIYNKRMQQQLSDLRQQPTATRQKSVAKLSFSWVIALMGIVVIIAAAAVYIITRNANTSAPNTTNTATSSADAALLTKLSSVMLLPEGEDPVISTITDAQGLKQDAPFYQNTENGDKILIYIESGKIIIYRESENLVVNAGPILDR
jgi:hypothetical protein